MFALKTAEQLTPEEAACVREVIANASRVPCRTNAMYEQMHATLRKELLGFVGKERVIAFIASTVDARPKKLIYRIVKGRIKKLHI